MKGEYPSMEAQRDIRVFSGHPTKQSHELFDIRKIILKIIQSVETKSIEYVVSVSYQVQS
jgi:hypothetical protein